jgi:hypothetical protein
MNPSRCKCGGELALLEVRRSPWGRSRVLRCNDCNRLLTLDDAAQRSKAHAVITARVARLELVFLPPPPPQESRRVRKSRQWKEQQERRAAAA